MSAFIFRFVLGLAAVWALEAAAQDNSQSYSSERGAPLGMDTVDSYVADPAQSYVTEGDDDAPETPVASAEPPRPRSTGHNTREQYDRFSYDRPQYDPAPTCRAYYPVGPGRDRSGTLCEQSDGSMRIVEAPQVETSPRTVSAAASMQYCREYQQDGVSGIAYGKACWQRDGSWQIVTAALGVPGRDYPRAYAAVSPEPRVTAPARSYKPRPVERRFKMPEFYFGNLFGWLRPHEGRY